jgi:hypothetical protein
MDNIKVYTVEADPATGQWLTKPVPAPATLDNSDFADGSKCSHEYREIDGAMRHLVTRWVD